MRILIVGNGGREHALAWKVHKDQPDATLFVTRPNGGMASFTRSLDISPGDVESLAGWAKAESIDLAIIGPEAPLADGLTDHLRKHKRDESTRRGLLQMVGRRRRLLRYLNREDLGGYRSLISKLGLRR